MRNIRQGFNELSTIKKILFFNLYAITFAVLMIISSFIIDPLFNYLFDGEINFEEIIENLTNIEFYLVKIFESYFIIFLVLLVLPISPKSKKE
ncbi:MAG: hypothetical protein WC135_08700 [Bacteroidales bacterium]